jgi:hypothetical protein
MIRSKLIILAACAGMAGGAALANEQSPAKKQPSPRALQASASYNPAADATDSRYDASCLAISAKGSRDYDNCLQKLPARNMVGGGGY